MQPTSERGTGVRRDLRAQRLLDLMVQHGALTPQGRDWLIMAVDPFHDVKLKSLDGFPDTQVSESIVQNVPRQVTITRPASFVGTTWSFMVVAYPWTGLGEGDPPADGLDMTGYHKKGNFIWRSETLGQKIWPFTVYMVDGGYGDAGPFVSANDVLGVGLGNDIGSGPFRRIGSAFELWDETADIYKQGSMTVWRQNTSMINHTTLQAAELASEGVSTGLSAFSATHMFRPPSNVTEANRLANTLSWSARYGCYAVAVMNEEQNKCKMPAGTIPVLVTQDTRTGVWAAQDGEDGQLVLAPTLQQLIIDEENYQVYFPSAAFGLNPQHMYGAIVNGLNNNAIFKLVTRDIVENMPSIYHEQWTHLTKPSANHDPLALEIYDRSLCGMPVAVFVSENSMGDWFYGIVKNAADLAAKSGIPVLSQVGNAGKLAIQAYESYEKAQRKPKLKNQARPMPALPRTPPQAKNPPRKPAPKRKKKPKAKPK